MNISNMPPRTLKSIVSEHRALAVLTALRDEPPGISNSLVLESWLHHIALCISGEDLRTCLEMLDREGLIRMRTIDDLLIAELTEKGERVANGEERVEGVARPSRDLPRR